MAGEQYIPRLIDGYLAERLKRLAAVLIVGPRATGKTTTARRLAASVVRLDRPIEAAAFRADPDAALRTHPEPVLLDEWQVVPEVLGAVKRAVDDDSRPGRFVLTGSVRADLNAPTWPGTGRVLRVSLWGLSERELAGRVSERGFLDRLAEGDPGAFSLPAEVPDLVGYLELALRGGYPEAVLRLAGEDRRAWLESYLDQLLTRDAVPTASRRDPARLRRYFHALALSAAGQATETTLYTAAGIDKKTAVGYEQLLENLFVLERVPAWTTNRLSRLVLSAKRYLVDPSLMAAALSLDISAVLRDGDLLGRLIDTFVVAQLRPEAALSALRPRLHHLRQRDGRHEVDLVVELAADRVLGIEVKAGGAPDRQDARHLLWLRDQLGERFVAGAVLHTGPASYRLDERVLAIPICALWG